MSETTLFTEAHRPPCGLHKGVDYDTYDRWDAVNHSKLRLFNRTPAHARDAMLEPKDQSIAQATGHCTHVAVLEPERFEMQYVVAPKYDKRTTAGKAGWAEFQAANVGRSIILQEDYDVARFVRDAVWRHPTAAELLKGRGHNEVSIVWKDEGTGILCKARLDRLTMLADWSCIVDLKTTKNASRSSFSRDVHSFHYHQQGAMYLDGTAAIAPRERKFLFIAAEKERPFCVAVYELEDDAITLGRDEYQSHLVQLAECMETGNWPAYGDGMDYVSLPSWAFRPIQGE